MLLFFNGCRKKSSVETFQSPYELIDEIESLSLLETESVETASVSVAKTISKEKNIDLDLNDKKIQTALKEAGFYDGKIDGKIGLKSKQAVRDFQTANNLKVDGVVGINTKKALQKYLTQ